MFPKYHILFGFIFSLVLFLIFPDITLVGAGIIFLSSFLIDVDHYVYYFFKKRDLNFSHSVKYFMNARKKISKMHREKRINYYSGFCFLHGIEILIILFILGIFISKYFLFVFLGFTLHLSLDVFEEIHHNVRIDKISLIYDWFKFRKLRIFK